MMLNFKRGTILLWYQSRIVTQRFDAPNFSIYKSPREGLQGLSCLWCSDLQLEDDEWDSRISFLCVILTYSWLALLGILAEQGCKTDPGRQMWLSLLSMPSPCSLGYWFSVSLPWWSSCHFNDNGTPYAIVKDYCPHFPSLWCTAGNEHWCQVMAGTENLSLESLLSYLVTAAAALNLL